MFCSECGAQNPDTNQFCRNCGKPLLHRAPAAPVAAPAAPSVQAPGYTAVPAQPAAAPMVPAAAAGTATISPKRQWNWLGMLSILPGLLSLVILPLLMACAAILLGIAGLLIFRRSAGRIGIASPIGILLGIVAIALKALVG